MRTTKSIRFVVSTPGVAIFLVTSFLFANHAAAADLKVMKMGLGSGTITSSPAGISCGGDCDEPYGGAVSVTLTATADVGSTFLGWDFDADGDPTTTPDCMGTSTTCTISMSVARSVRPVFDLTPVIPTLSSFTPGGIAAYLTANPAVNSAARFIKALPAEYKQNWILMSRSESLQTGTSEMPRILLPSVNAQSVFTVGMAIHSSYPGAHPNAIEYMQWDLGDKNFRFHEIILDAIPAMGSVPARSRGVSIDDEKCSKCHSTQNVLNRGTTPGTTGITPGTLKAKNKPNWDSYDSWGGMIPFNRDRIYQGTVEAAAFRKLFNPWTWRANGFVRSIIEQLKLQPSGVVAVDAITRRRGGANDGHVNFAFDVSPPVLTEPAPSGSAPAIATAYSFDGIAGAGPTSSVTRGGSFVHLRHTGDFTSTGINVEGRGVQLFDLLGGADGGMTGIPNAHRIVDELIDHRFATGSVPIDVRPIALAITKRCLDIDTATNTVTSTPPLTINLAFFDARNGMKINELVADTRARTESVPRRKADIQKLNLDRTGDPYLVAPTNGLIQQHGAGTSAGMDTAMPRLRQEVFRRPVDLGRRDVTVMGRIFVDRELYGKDPDPASADYTNLNTRKMALFRYFLEPLGVSVDKWSMGVRGRSRTYSFADVFGSYEEVLEPELEASLGGSPDCTALIAAVNSTLSSLPPAAAVPTYTDVQRIFNKSCTECHGGLDYPPYSNYGSVLDLSEDENPPTGDDRLDRSHGIAIGYVTTDPATSYLYQRITDTSEDCPFGLMPCGGPQLSRTDIETIRRWIAGAAPNTRGDPHIETIDGTNYDFQAAGEFVLLRGENLEIQVRQTAVATDGSLGPNPHTGLTSCVSVNGAVAVRVGRHRITYQPNLSGQPDPEGLQLRIDGKLQTMSARGIPLASGGRIVQTTAPGGLQIEAPGGTVVVITPGWWDYYRMWYMNVDARHVRATEGVMGAIAPGNWLPALPDGSFLGPRPADLQQRYKDLYLKFGNAWRVRRATTLFDYAPGTSTETFTVEGWPNGESPRSCVLPPRPGIPPVRPPAALALEEAEQHCSDIIAEETRANCVQDVMVTGEPGFAQNYMRAEQIERNRIPPAPALIFPENFKTGLAAPVSFAWSTTHDLDGDPVTYRHCVWEVKKRFTLDDCKVVADRTASWRGSILVAFLGCLVSVVLIDRKKRPGRLGLMAIAILAMVSFGFSCSGKKPITNNEGRPFTRTVSELEPGKAYYWKVIVEDGKGGTTESETRRFEIR